MRLKSAKLFNYRMHGTLQVSFDPSRTVIGGPNEAGKSTLAEAIHRALFLRYSSTVDLEDIQPRHATGTPEVILEFERHGHEYELHKRFKGGQGSMAKLVDRSTGATLTGDEAEEKLRGLLAVGEVSPRQFRTQWSHLWVWQGTAAVDPTTAEVVNDSAERLRDRLAAGAGTNLTESARDTATCTRIAAAHAETYGARNAVLRNSDLGQARVEAESARAAAAAAAGSLAALGDAAETIAREAATIQAARATLDEAGAAVHATEAMLVRIETTERTLEHRLRIAEAAANAYTDLSDGDAAIRKVEEDAAAIAAVIAPQQAAIDEAIARERRCQDDEAEAVALLTGALEAQREASRDRDLFTTLELVEQLANRQALLEASLRRINDDEAALARLDEQLRGVPAVGQQQFDEIVTLDQKLQVARGTLRAIATRIDVVAAAAAVTLDGEPLTAGGGTTLTEAADLVVAGGTTFRITPGGGQTLADVRLSIADLENQLDEKLAAVGVPTADAARAARATRANLESRRDQLTATGADLKGEEARADLRQTLSDLGAAEAEIARLLPPGRERPADATARAAAAAAARLRDDAAEQAVRVAQDRAAAARAAATTAAADRRAAESAVAASNDQVQRLAGKRTALLAQYGDDRKPRLAELAAAKQQAEDAVTESTRALASLQPEQVRADRARLNRTIDVSTKQITDAEVRQAKARGRLESGGTLDLHATKADADARLGIAERRLAEVERRSRAIDLLRTLFESRRQAVAAQVAAPLRAKVAEYLDALYGPGSRVEVALTPRGLADLQVARPVAGGLTFAFAELSGGTREQVAAACRLAMAELLAGDGSCLPVVFDDAFTNSDPERIAAVQRVLDLGARRGLQIIVLSCNPRAYGLLGATAVDLPPPRHDASPGGSAAETP